MLLTVRQLNLAYGPRVLFRDAGFQVQPHDRTGLVGPNGSGKSTLLKILNGLAEADSISKEVRGDVTFGYLPQEGIVLADRPVIEEVEAAASDIQSVQAHQTAAEAELQRLEPGSDDYSECLERYTHYTSQLEDLEAHKLRSKAEKILFGLGFTEGGLARSCGEFSGGWQMRIALARLLLEEPDLLMMDEPTNHLDLDSLRWLENFLNHYPGAVLLISHDRALLDQFCSSILSIERREIVPYTGNYTAFLDQRGRRQEQLESARKSQDRKIAQTERFIERFRYKASKASQVQSRIKALGKIERVGTESGEKTIHFSFPLSRKGGHVVATADAISKAYGSVRVFDGFSLKIQKGDRIGVVGINGAGKSTLARILAGREPADTGTVELGYQVDVGYFAQDQSDEMDTSQSVFGVASSPPVRAGDTHIRSVLGAFLFSGDDMDKPVSVLSGGEKNRLALARLLLCPANFLLLDEPTNHLDMASKAVLQEALKAFPGTTFVVSHDRHFLNPVVNKILEIQPGKARVFPGNLDDYIWKIDQVEGRGTRDKGRGSGVNEKPLVPRPSSPDPRPPSLVPQPSPLNPKERRRRQARRQEAVAPLKRNLRSLEGEITDLEEKIRSRESEMADKAFFERGGETADEVREYETWKALLSDKLEKWEATAAELESLEAEDSGAR